MLESAKVRDAEIEATLDDALDDAPGLRDDEGPEDEAFDATVIGRRRPAISYARRLPARPDVLAVASSRARRGRCTRGNAIPRIKPQSNSPSRSPTAG